MDLTAELSPLAREIKKRHPFTDPSEEALLNLMRTASWVGSRSERVFKRHGLSSPKYNVLRILRGATETGEAGPGGLPSLEVAARLITRVPDITRLVDSLQESGLVTRTRCTEDRRVVYVGITPAGTELLARLDGPLADCRHELFGHLVAADLADLNRLLDRVRDCPTATAFDEDDDPAAK